MIAAQRDLSCFQARFLNPKRAIERAVLNRFAHVLRRDVDLVVQIGNGARDFQDAIVSAALKFSSVMATRISSCESALNLQCCLR